MSGGAICLLENFARRYRGAIASDGDLDGIFATGLLVRYLRGIGIDVRYYYPSPRELRGLTVDGYILVELPLTRGLIYRGENILIDHHNGPARIELFRDSEVVKSFSLGEAKSVADLVVRVLDIDIDAELLDAVNQIDMGEYRTPLAEMIHKAYLLNISSSEMRIMLTELVAGCRWNEIKEWAKKEHTKWNDLVEPRINYFVKKAQVLVPRVVFFIYREDNDIDKAARTPALMRLEDMYDIVISIGVDENNNAVAARIATKKPIDLTKVFEQLRKMGHNAGGRANVGGVQFKDRTLGEAIADFRRVKWPK